MNRYNHGMTAIYMVSMIHVLWGIFLTLAPVAAIPRPFGAMEPYFDIMTPRETGLMLLTAASLAIFSSIFGAARWWVGPMLTTPQQIILMFGFLGALKNLFEVEEQGRTALALAYVVSLTIFHTIDVHNYWRTRYLQRGSS